jgi:prepilin-type N-terminal cleavage/methylation domain-containing protein
VKRSGYTLVELLLALALFGILNALMFSLLQTASRSFGIAISRSTLQSELNLSLVRLQADVRRSSASLLSIAADAGRSVDGQRRDGVCVSALRDWRAGSSYSPQAEPLWDEYVVYYATREQPGRLIRQLHHPAGAPYSMPLAGFAPASHMNDDSGSNGADQTTVLAQNLEQFRISYDGGSSVVALDLLLRKRGGLTPEGRRVNEERVQATCLLRLGNP